MQHLAGGKKCHEGKQEISSALKIHPPPLFCHRGRSVGKQQTPPQRTGSPFLRFGSLHLLWLGSFSGYPLRSRRIMGSPSNFKPPPHACVSGISVDSGKQISGLSLCEPRPLPRFSNSILSEGGKDVLSVRRELGPSNFRFAKRDRG